MPSSTLRVIENGGRFLPHDKPADVAGAVLSALYRRNLAVAPAS